MKCKKVYLGQDLNEEDWSYGIGSVYLAGPRNKDGVSWRINAIKRIESSRSPICIIIPETRNQLKDGLARGTSKERFEWQHLAISVANSIIFWYPLDSVDIQSYVEFGTWHKVERIFLGREDGKTNEYLEWLLHKEQQLYPAENIDQAADMAVHWLRE